MKGFTITLLVVATFSLSACLPARNPADKLMKRGKKPFLIYSVFLSFVSHIFFLNSIGLKGRNSNYIMYDIT